MNEIRRKNEMSKTPNRRASQSSSKKSIEQDLKIDLRYERSKSTTSLLHYQPLLVSAKKSKQLASSFSIYDLPRVRESLKRSFIDEDQRRLNRSRRASCQLVTEFAMDDYFRKKSNWVNDSRFTYTSSLYSTIQCYLPALSKHFKKY
jgi:hypothetical protein